VSVSAQIELRRHCRKLSEKDTDAVVQAVADLIVSYLKRDPEAGETVPDRTTTTGAVAPKKETHS
jgi:hypothetical protein